MAEDIEAWIHTRASLPRYAHGDERYVGDVNTHVTARGSTPENRAIAGQMAEGIGRGSAAGGFDYLARIRARIQDDD